MIMTKNSVKDELFEEHGTVAMIFRDIVADIDEESCEVKEVQYITQGSKAGILANIEWYRNKAFENADKEQRLMQSQEAQAFLNATDWVENQLSRCERLYGKTSTRYKELFEKRKEILLQREEWVEIVRGCK